MLDCASFRVMTVTKHAQGMSKPDAEDSSCWNTNHTAARPTFNSSLRSRPTTSTHHPTTHPSTPSLPPAASQLALTHPPRFPYAPAPNPHHRTQRRKRGRPLAMAISNMKRNSSSSNSSIRSYSSAGEVRATCYAASMTCSTAVHGFHYSTTGANGVDWRA